MSADHTTPPPERGLTRRTALQRALAAGMAVSASGLLAACGADGTTSATTVGGGTPRRGGRLRVGALGGGVNETLDPHAGIASVDAARAGNLYDRLVRLDSQSKLKLELAESFEPNRDGTEWTVRLRRGVVFHDGKPLTADDLIWNLQRIGAPNSALFGVTNAKLIDLKRMRKLDRLTVRLPLHRPNAELPAFFSDYYMAIAQAGTTRFDKPVGTGPFKFASFQPGRNSLFTRNDDYWQSGRPYVDELEIVSIPDQTARVNALLGGQVDAVEYLDFPTAKAQMAGDAITVLKSDGSGCVPITMATDLKPFDDNRVRQAFRLLADRQRLIDNAQLGFGEIGNDLYGATMPDYAAQIPQREPDVEKARALLKAAGASDLSVTLWSSRVAPGMLESAQLFAEQAKEAGVTVNVNNGPADTYFTDKYMKVPFAQSQWPTRPISQFMTLALLPGGNYNETHWDRPAFTKRFFETIATLDDKKRADGYAELQRELWDEGGYLIWGTSPFLDGLSKRVNGVVPNPAQPLGDYDYKEYWLA